MNFPFLRVESFYGWELWEVFLLALKAWKIENEKILVFPPGLCMVTHLT